MDKIKAKINRSEYVEAGGRGLGREGARVGEQIVHPVTSEDESACTSS